MDLKEVGVFGGDQERHWYYVSKSAALLRCVGRSTPQRILDVGAGTGFFARSLLRRTSAVTATCVDLAYREEWCESLDGKRIEFRRTAPCAQADLVLLMDVLEHVDDDAGLLRHHVEVAPPGARFVVSVPAFSWLWSPHDTFLQHRRRYTLAQLTALMTVCGLERTDGFYFFGLVFPAAAARRLLQRLDPRGPAAASDMRDHGRWLNGLLRRMCLVEARIARYNRAFGLTAFAVGEKPTVSRVRL